MQQVQQRVMQQVQQQSLQLRMAAMNSAMNPQITSSSGSGMPGSSSLAFPPKVLQALKQVRCSPSLMALSFLENILIFRSRSLIKSFVSFHIVDNSPSSDFLITE